MTHELSIKLLDQFRRRCYSNFAFKVWIYLY